MVRYPVLLLDADRTLFDFDKSEEMALQKALEESGLPFSRKILAAYMDINNACWKALEEGKITRPALLIARFRGLLDYLGAKGDPEALNARYVEHLGEGNYLLPHAQEVCRRLSEHCTLVLVTNGLHKAQSRRFAESAIREYFDGIFISEDIGFDKPDPRYFEEVLRHYPGREKHDFLVVGDSLSSDIKGAANAGLDSCWLNPRGEANPKGIPVTYEIKVLPQLVTLILGE